MLATSRMWRSTRWMLAVWWRPLRAGAPAGKRRLARLMLFHTTSPRGRLHRVRTFCSRPIRRWPCLIRSGRAVAAAEEPVEEVVVAAVRVEEARAAAVGVAPVEGVVPEAVAREAAVKAAPAGAQAVEERAAPVAQGAAPAVE